MTQTTSKKTTGINAQTIALTAMFAALVTVTTAFIKIPAPLGYTHAGDSMIYLAACSLPGPFGFLAAAIGGALADILSGYAHWAIPTAIIKSLNVLPFFIVRYALKNRAKKDAVITLPNLLMLIPTTLITLGGYFAANALMYDASAAFAELLPNLIQAAVGAAGFIVIGLGLDAVGFKKKLLPRL